MDKLILYIYFLWTAIPLSGIKNFSNFSPQNLSGILLTLLMFFLPYRIKIKKRFIFFYLFLILSMIFNFNKVGILLLCSFTPLFYYKYLVMKSKKVLIYVKYQLILLNLIFYFDFIYRFKGDPLAIKFSLLNFISSSLSSTNFYIYKTNTFLFIDTNFVSIMIGTTYLFWKYLEKEKVVKKMKIKYLLLLLLLFTYSRAAILSIIIVFIYNVYIKQKTLIKKSINTILFIYLIFNFNNIYKLLIQDESIKARIIILQDFFLNIFNLKIYELFLGVGFYNSVEILGKAGHISFVTFILESGIIVFIFIISIFKFLWNYFKEYRDILIFNLFCFLSVTQYNYIFLISILTSLKVIKESKNKLV